MRPTALRLVVGVVLACVGLCSQGQAQTVLFEDFESGGQGWTMTPQWGSLWHVSGDGECGALTRMASYNRYPAACDFYTGPVGGSNNGNLISPEFVSPSGSLTLEFDYLKVANAINPYFWSDAFIFSGTNYVWAFHGLPDTTTEQHYRCEVGLPSSLVDGPIMIRFFAGPDYFETENSGSGLGWMIDNVRVSTRPDVRTVSPNHASNSAFTHVTITGLGFLGATDVSVGSTSALFTVDSDYQITADIPPTNTTGFAAVSVTAPSGTGHLGQGIDYFEPPQEIARACSDFHLSWSGSPTIGQVYTVTTENLGSYSQALLVDWSNLGSRVPHRMRDSGCSTYMNADGVISMGTTPSRSFFIWNNFSLIGVHLRTQALILADPPMTTQILDATIQE